MHTVFPTWPYPHLIAHRGAGLHAPENTLSAFREGAKAGYRMFEYDVKLSKDGVPILLHDDTVNRTSNGDGLAKHLSLASLMELDFGSWHSPPFIGEPLLTLGGIASFCLPNHLHSNIEIKPSAGLEAETGAAVARLAASLWQGAPETPLLSSFSITALKAARLAAPDLPLAWLIDDELPSNWRNTASELQVIGLNLNDKHVTAEHIQSIQGDSYAVCVWTVNTIERARELLGWGCNSVITDAVHEIPPDLTSSVTYT